MIGDIPRPGPALEGRRENAEIGEGGMGFANQPGCSRWGSARSRTFHSPGSGAPVWRRTAGAMIWRTIMRMATASCEPDDRADQDDRQGSGKPPASQSTKGPAQQPPARPESAGPAPTGEQPEQEECAEAQNERHAARGGFPPPRSPFGGARAVERAAAEQLRRRG